MILTIMSDIPAVGGTPTCLQSSEEVFYALEDRIECVLTIRNGLSRLGEFGVMMSHGIDWVNKHSQKEGHRFQ
jgi:hypothetical protein